MSIAGCFRGQCLFYETDGLVFKNKIHVRSSRGRNSKGAKITGFDVVTLPPSFRYSRSTPFDSDVKLLVSTNDSRVRMYNMHDQMLDMKFKGLENEQSQITASFSDDVQYIISGSEDNRTYIWSVKGSMTPEARKKDIQDYEYFHSNQSMVTAAVFAPTLTRKILAASNDPIYDLCDPPPVRLSPSPWNREPDIEIDPETGFPKLRPDTKRSRHQTGLIIVTADKAGTIKIFRQDCAYGQRRQLADSTSQKKRLSTLGSLSPTHSWHSLAGRTRNTRAESLTSSLLYNDTGSARSRHTSPSPVR
jgi:WD40 repeat protein